MAVPPPPQQGPARATSVNLRCAEYHTMRQRGSLADPGHYDLGAGGRGALHEDAVAVYRARLSP